MARDFAGPLDAWAPEHQEIGTNVFDNLIIKNPKRDSQARRGRGGWFSYYAGFSPDFAQSLIASADLPRDAHIMDPWNGSGTTTAAASALGLRSTGFDLNPVMVIAAKARSVQCPESVVPDALAEVLRRARSYEDADTGGEDPLCAWLVPRSALALRKIDRALQAVVLADSAYRPLGKRDSMDSLSDLAAFFYVALFRTARSLLRGFSASNPTWMKTPTSKSARRRPSAESVLDIFKAEVWAMIEAAREDARQAAARCEDTHVGVASSDALPLADNSVDLVLSSPPYCTRIDYAVATMPELAILGYTAHNGFRELRRSLIGTPTVPSAVVDPSPEWGETCNQFLDRVASHPSKASKSYYYKNHVQYFDAIYRSFSEIHRTLRTGGVCLLVVQDSHYKDVHNDLPRIFGEMGRCVGLTLRRRYDFPMSRTMAGVNPGTKRYRRQTDATESVLCLGKRHPA